MLWPTVFERDLWDHFWGAPPEETRLMRTDIRDTEGGYEFCVDLPGFRKEDVDVDLRNGYLTVRAKNDYEEDGASSGAKYLRRERYAGTFSRSFYVGEGVSEDEIRAKFENGTLMLSVPKKDSAALPERKRIAIE